MADTKTFYLPDLGEGLPDATVVEWHVKVGDNIKLDAPLCSMETAKAVVDVPSPYTGKVTKLHGAPGDVIETGAALADFEPDPNAKQRAESQDTGHQHGPKKPAAGAGTPTANPDDAGDSVVASDEGGVIEETGKAREDEGTVVGAMVSGNTVHVEQAASIGGVKAVPAVRALAKKLKVDLSRVRPSGADGVVTMKDVKEAAANGSAVLGARAGARCQSTSAPAGRPSGARAAAARAATRAPFRWPANRCAPRRRRKPPAASPSSSRACVATWPA